MQAVFYSKKRIDRNSRARRKVLGASKIKYRLDEQRHLESKNGAALDLGLKA